MKQKGILLKDLLEAGVHFGHQSSRWHPQMKPYLYGVRDGVHVFDLIKTKKELDKACDFVRQLTAQGQTIIFAGTKRQAQAIIKEEAKKAGVPYVSQRWLGGTLTNWEQIKKSIDKLKKMKEEREKGEFKKYTKKEQLLLDREIARLEKFFGGLVTLESPPEAVFVVDTHKEVAVVKEAKKKGIKIVGLVDSNSDPREIDYVIPGNDDAVGSIKVLVAAVAEAARIGQEEFAKKSKKKKNEPKK